jgi:MFS family permease
MFLGMSMFGVLSFLPLYGRTVLHESATGSGRILIPLLLAMVIGSGFGARIVLKLGFRIVVTVGAGLVVVGCLLLTRLDVDSSQLVLSGYLVVLGVGMGLVFMSTSLAAQNSVTTQQMGVSTGLINFTRQLGGAVGIAIAASVLLTNLTSRLADAFGDTAFNPSKLLTPTDQATPLTPETERIVSEAFAGALHRVFWVAVVVAVIGLICTRMMPRGSAAAIRDEARSDAKLDAVGPDGETFAVASQT